MLAGIQDQFTQNQKAFNAMMDAAATRQATQAQPPTYTINNLMQPTPVEIRNEITTPPQTVHVTNEVQPASVDVSVTATLPRRTSETTVERDAQRNIVKSVTVEKDA